VKAGMRFFSDESYVSLLLSYLCRDASSAKTGGRKEGQGTNLYVGRKRIAASS
jgi:hypothetical protein